MNEEEIKVQDFIEHIRFGTQLKYEMKTYMLAIERLLDLYKAEKEKNKKLKKSLLYMVNQFAYDEKAARQEDERLSTGGLSALEEAFDVLDIEERISRRKLWDMIQELLESEEQ